MAAKRFAVLGPSGGGKTTFVKNLKMALETAGGQRVAVISQDRYYRDLSHLPKAERGLQNFDHPDALNMDLFGEHIHCLMDGVPIEVPNYCFKDHIVLPEVQRIDPNDYDVIILEGVMLFAHAYIAGHLYNDSAYVDVGQWTCFWRRFHRDRQDRDRTIWSIIRQYCTQVYPGYLDHVQPRQYRARFQVTGEVTT